MVEGEWRRVDNRQSTREHYLMALADVQAILVKASLTTSTIEARISDVSLDVADRRASENNPVAYEVEEVRLEWL